LSGKQYHDAAVHFLSSNLVVTFFKGRIAGLIGALILSLALSSAEQPPARVEFSPASHEVAEHFVGAGDQKSGVVNPVLLPDAWVRTDLQRSHRAKCGIVVFVSWEQCGEPLRALKVSLWA
jgi:hypothetical protein